MAANFKCCKTKEHPNWFCLVCKNVFHKSCWQRRSAQTYRVIIDNLIWCSPACIEKAPEDSLDLIDDLRLIITELKNEVDEKTSHIARLKRSSASFYREAASTEIELVQEIEHLKAENAALREKLSNSEKRETKQSYSSSGTQTCLYVKNSSSQTENTMVSVHTQYSRCMEEKEQQTQINMSDLEFLQRSDRDSKTKIDELEKLRNSMVTTIETLTVENDWYANEVIKLKGDSRQLEGGIFPIAPNRSDVSQMCVPSVEGRDSDMEERWEGELIVNQEHSIVNQMQKSNVGNGRTENVRKILIYGDESGRNLASTLRLLLDDSFEVMGEVMSNMSLDILSTNIFSVCKNYTKNDFMILCLNIRCKDRVRISSLEKILAVSKFTNLILCVTYDSRVFSQCIGLYRKINDYCSLYMKNKNASFRIIENKKIGNKLRLNRSSLCKLFIMYLGSFNIHNVVLSSIRLQTSVVSDGESDSFLLNVSDSTPDVAITNFWHTLRGTRRK